LCTVYHWQNWPVVLNITITDHRIVMIRFKRQCLIHLMNRLFTISRNWWNVMSYCSLQLIEARLLRSFGGFGQWLYLETVLLCCLIYWNHWNFIMNIQVSFHLGRTVVLSSSIWLRCCHIHIPRTVRSSSILRESEIMFDFQLVNMINWTIAVLAFCCVQFRIETRLIYEGALLLV